MSYGSPLERVPGRPSGKLKIAEIGAEPETDSGADRYHENMIGGQRRHAEPADEIGRPIDSREALIDRFGRRQIVDQHHRARAVASHVETDRGPFPEHAAVASIAGIELAVAVAQPDHHRAAAFLAEDI